MRKWQLLLFAVLLTSCSNRKNDVINDIMQSYLNNTEQNMNTVLFRLHQFEKVYALNYKKAGPYREKALAVHKAAQGFYDSVSVFVQDDNSAGFSIGFLATMYRQVIDTFLVYDPLRRKTYESAIKYTDHSSKTYFKSHPKLTALMMQNELAHIESRLLLWLLWNTEGIDDWFNVNNIESQTASHPASGAYVFTLSSFEFQQIPDKKIIIDTLLRNNRIFEYEPKVTSLSSFAAIQYDSLQYGSYEVRGRVKLFSQHGLMWEYPFKHEFSIRE